MGKYLLPLGGEAAPSANLLSTPLWTQGMCHCLTVKLAEGDLNFTEQCVVSTRICQQMYLYPSVVCYCLECSIALRQ